MKRLIMIQTTRSLWKIFVNPEHIIKCVQDENEYTISLHQEGTYQITKESFNRVMMYFNM